MDVEAREEIHGALRVLKERLEPKAYMKVLAAIETPIRPRHHRLNVKDAAAALELTKGIVAAAADLLGVHRNTLFNYIKKHPKLKSVTDNSREVFKDFVEKGIMKKILVDEDNTMMIFFAKTKMQDRGYTEKHQFEDVTARKTGVLLIEGTIDAATWDAKVPAELQLHREKIIEILGEYGAGDGDGRGALDVDFEIGIDEEQAALRRGNGD